MESLPIIVFLAILGRFFYRRLNTGDQWVGPYNLTEYFADQKCAECPLWIHWDKRHKRWVHVNGKVQMPHPVYPDASPHKARRPMYRLH